MNTIIQQLIRDISLLPLPIESSILKNIFDSVQGFDDTTLLSTLPLNIQNLWAQLNALNMSALKEQQTQNRLKELTQSLEFLQSLDGRKAALQESHGALNRQITERESKLTTLFNRQILARVNESLLKEDPEFPIYIPNTNITTQKSIVSDYLIKVSSDLLTLDTPAAKIKLIQLKETIDLLINQLNNLNVLCLPNYNLEKYHSLSTKIQSELEILINLQPKFHDLQQKFALQLSVPDIQRKITEVDQQNDHILIKQQALQEELEKHPLPKKAQTRLIDEFQTSKQTTDLIAFYQEKIDTTTSILSPSSWIAWSSDAQYNEHQEEFINSVSYLTLLAKKRQLDLKFQSLLDQKSTLLGLINSVPEKSDEGISHLITEAMELINTPPANKPAIALSSTSCSTDFYLTLLNNIPYVQNQIDQKTLALGYLDDIIKTLTQLNTLRSLFNLPAELDSSLPDKSVLEHTVDSIKEQTSIREDLLFQKDLCKQYLMEVEELEQLLKEDKRIVFDIKIIDIEQGKTRSAPAEQITSLTALKSSLQTEIAQQIKQIINANILTTAVQSAVPLPVTPSSILFVDTQRQTTQEDLPIHVIERILEPAEELLLEAPPSLDLQLMEEQAVGTTVIKELIDDVLTLISDASLSIEALHSSPTAELSPLQVSAPNQEANQPTELIVSHEETDAIKHWHELNMNFLSQHSLDLQEWYLSIYTAVGHCKNDSRLLYKCSHLIRDIHFELEKNIDLSTINAYRLMCPNPARDINILLDLKPDLPVPLFEEPLNIIQELPNFPPEFKQLYNQYNKLEKTHPLEADLLSQALHILLLAKKYKDDSSIERPVAIHSIPALDHDPRYNSLKRHRGFLRIWEMLEDLCRLIIGTISCQPEYQYKNRPCFFKTQSVKLMEEATLLVKEDSGIYALTST